MLRAELVKNYIVYEGEIYKDKKNSVDSMGRLCRDLVHSGAPEGAMLKCYRGETLCLTVDIHARAQRVLRETDTRGLELVRYREFKLTSDSAEMQSASTSP